jgi:predicted TIM-barrel fold metal-dependent hydrolase
VPGSLREIAYALDTLQLMGIGMFTSYGRRWLGDPLFAPVFEELDRRNAIVYVHPTLNECCANLLPDVTESIIEYGTDTTRTIASLVFSGTTSRYPGVRFIFSHGGGTFPFLIERFDRLAKNPKFAARLPRGLRHELTRFYYDTAQASNPGAMSSLKHLVPWSQILFGTDYPYRRASEYLGALEACGFSPGEIEDIHRHNAERLIG